MDNQNTTPVVANPSPAPYGGFWRRFWAFWIDAIISSLLPAILCFALALLIVWKTANTPQEPVSAIWLIPLYLLWCVLGLICTWLYFALLESSKHQATLGKLLLGLKVVDKQGQRLSFARATGRYFAKLLSYAIMYIGFLMMPFTNRKRALHDMIAGTYVVKSSYQAGEPLPPTPRHLIWLTVVILLVLALFVGIIKFSLAVNTYYAQTKAKTAAAQLFAIQTDENWERLPGTEEMDFSYDDDGNLYATFQDSQAKEYVLVLPAEESEVCCLNPTDQECHYIAVPPCH